MIFIALPILFFLVFYKIKFAKPNNYFDDNLSKEKTSSINGIFVALVFFSHIGGYLSKSFYDEIYYSIPLICTQMIVVSFLFFSGYGMMESLKAKGTGYAKTIATKRLPKLFINFSLAVSVYAIVNLIIGKPFTLSNYLLSLIGWDSIGNSNWYIFAIFSFYIIFIVSFLIMKNKSLKAGLILTIILSFIYIVIISFFQPSYYYDTFLCLSFGMFMSMFKEKIYQFLTSKHKHYYIVLSVSIILFCITFVLFIKNPFLFNITSLLFAFLLYLITLKINCQNFFLNWLGNNVFWIYILQRLPMIFLSHLGLHNFSVLLYVICSILITIILAIIFKFLENKIEKLIWKNKKRLKNK